MDVRIHHNRKLPLEIRATFELPAWPYTQNPEHLELFEKYLRSLHVIRYDDSHSDPNSLKYDFAFILNDIEVGGENHVFPIDGYFSRVAVHPDTFKVLSWPRNRDHDADPQWLENVENNPISGDMLAWSHFNKKIRIHENTQKWIRWEPRDGQQKPDGQMEEQRSSTSSDFISPNAPRT